MLQRGLISSLKSSPASLVRLISSSTRDQTSRPTSKNHTLSIRLRLRRRQSNAASQEVNNVPAHPSGQSRGEGELGPNEVMFAKMTRKPKRQNALAVRNPKARPLQGKKKKEKSVPVKNAPVVDPAREDENLEEQQRESQVNDKPDPSLPSSESAKGTRGHGSLSEELRDVPPHSKPPLPYTRRVEGILQWSDRLVLEDVPSPSEHHPIAKLSHGLDRVLFNPGVHWLKDPRSQVYNFSPRLELVPNVNDFAFERIPAFIKSSRDEDLWALAKQERRTFSGSTSSLTGILSQLYFLISEDRAVDVSTLSRHFQRAPTNFTPGQRMPSSIVMKFKDGVYAIDSDPSTPGSGDKNILSWQGTMLEKFLTSNEDEFDRLMRTSASPAILERDNRREAYRFAKSEKFVMRSQLDCGDSRLPGTGVFDIKTRAALPIRLDLFNYEENSGYLIRSLYGSLESFEKEYYDLICSAFLKYSFQARIGNMDGVFVAYHNTALIFGFQYIPLDEMDERLFGGTGRGQLVFEKCIRMLEVVAEEIIHLFPNMSLKCTFEAQLGKGEMNVYVEPADWSDEDSKPIAQLNVSAVNYLGGYRVSGIHAVTAVGEPWTLHWGVAKSALSDQEIRQNLAACKERQFRAWCLPTGVSMKEMAERWHALDFGGKKIEGTSEDIPFDPSLFRKANRITKELRAIARAGRDETKRMTKLCEGTKKIVLGEAEDDRANDGVNTSDAAASTEDASDASVKTIPRSDSGKQGFILATTKDPPSTFPPSRVKSTSGTEEEESKDSPLV